MQTICTFEELLTHVQSSGIRKMAIANAQDETALSAFLEARKTGMVEGKLFGDKPNIEEVLQQMDPELEREVEIIHCSNEMEANHEAVVAVRKREVDILMKGKTKTKELLQLVLDEESGLCCGRVISDAFVFENPARPRENKLTIFTDGGINVKPNLKQKIEIVRNAVELSHLLGHPNPRVAILSADETVRAGLPSTLDAAILSKMNQRGQIRGCVIDGPLALDHAVSPDALHMKRIDSPIQGDADILIAPDIESANMLGKSATVWAGFRLGHVIVRALAPILIPSQADSTEAKLLFIALGCIICIL